MKRLTSDESEMYKLYCVPGSPNTQVKLNAIFLRKTNSWDHEFKKFELCWKLLNINNIFISEAQRLSDGKIVDVVDVTEQNEYEIVYCHESDAEIKVYRDNHVFVILAGDSFVCSVCNEIYPLRNKSGVCQNCKVVKE